MTPEIDNGGDTPDEEDEENGNHTTTNQSTRWDYTGTISALSLVFALVATVIGAAAGYLSLAVIPQAFFLLFATAVTAAIAWIFGEGKLSAAREVFGK